MVGDEAVGREPLHGRGAARAPVEARRPLGRQRQPGDARSHEPGDAVVDDLSRGTTWGDDDRRPARERFDHDHAERLRPGDGVEQADRVREQGELVRRPELTHVGDLVAEQGLHRAGKPRLLGRLAHLGGDPQRHARAARDVTRRVDALVGMHAAEEDGIAASAGSERVIVDPHPMVDRGRDRHVARRPRVVGGDRDHGHTLTQCPVEVSELGGERTVRRRDDGNTRKRLGIERPDERVVVHHVGSELCHRLVGGDHMPQLAGTPADAEPEPFREDRCGRHCTGAVRGREEQHVMTCVLQTTCERVEHGFGTAVHGRRYGDPGWGDDADAHAQPSDRPPARIEHAQRRRRRTTHRQPSGRRRDAFLTTRRQRSRHARGTPYVEATASYHGHRDALPAHPNDAVV